MANTKALNKRDELDAILDNWRLSLEEQREQAAQLGFKKMYAPTGDGTSDYKYLSLRELKNYVVAKALSIQPKFEFTDEVKNIMNLLTLYRFQDEEFENLGYSNKKGIYLVGNIGTGKTTLMEIFNLTYNCHIVNTAKIADAYQGYGIERIESYSNGEVIFDDIGCERIPVLHMGNSLNVMQKIIIERYEKGLHSKTHFTSNLDAEQIEQLYGSRVASRLAEMVNFIVLPGDDRRRK